MGLVKTAAASDNPTAWVDHVRLFDTRGPVPDDEDFSIPFGVAAEIMAVVTENSFGDLVAPPVRVTTADVPVPFSAPLEQHIEPTTGKIVAAVREVTGLGPV